MKINPVHIVYTVLFIVIAYILFKLFKNLSSIGLGVGEEIEEQEKDIEGVSIDWNLVQKPKSELKMRADLSLQAMDDIGTNEKLLFEAVEGLNSEELKALYKYFGLKSERVFWVPVFTGNLINWYYNELGAKDLLKMKNIWAKTGLMP